MRHAAPAALLVLAASALAGCGGTTDTSGPDDAASAQSSASSSPDGPTAGSPTAEPTGAVTPTTDLLDWSPVPGSSKDVVTSNGDWTLRVSVSGRRASLEGPDGVTTGATGSSGRVSDALLDQNWAVVVRQDPTEQQPSRATITDLETGRLFALSGGSDMPTVNGGTWALGADRVVHATMSRGRYCLASVDLTTQRSSLGYCAPMRSGFNSAHLTDAGDSLLSFDDSQPSCQSVLDITSSPAEPFPGVTRCKAGEGLLTGDGAVWSVIAKPNQYENATFHARVGDRSVDLGPGTTGSLIACGGAAYFVRDPRTDTGTAALMRWADDELSVVYESPAGPAFLSEPRCGGDRITVTAFAEGGDEQVEAPTG